ncbi:amylo-alpha-1,6-glucosidase [Actinoallomurus spadix]|uniref:Glycogen debranching N-terminal domain-containing protein n=1 Tax=Actinoallomurus spadix TaxID=79912 RepID=A0ABN0X292_9ACTN|nr:glycogen debranching N-terminal domain-containing protein [Actinoallomurus spadix]MCO5991495.1 amylo-alpha-1,6-glucosidase [Actinoallomurus spadix]
MSQSSLHEHLTCLAAPALWLSPPSGQLTGGADGLYVADRRVLSRLVLTLDGAEPEPAGATMLGADAARFTAALGDLTVERTRTARRDGGTEEIRVRNDGAEPVTVTVSVEAAADLAEISDVKAWHAGEPGREGPDEAPLRDGIAHTGPDGYTVLLTGRLRAEPALAPGEEFTTTLTVRATPPPVEGFRQAPPDTAPPWSATPLTVRSEDRRLDALVGQGIADLGALLLADEGDPYCAAGSPWYLTLFGRDSLWTARLALPLGWELAAGTLRALARHQGARHDPETEEAPGKIPHELRPAHAAGWLPPVYYGTVDATPLFVTTLVEAWRWGMPDAEVEALLPAAERALTWIEGFGDAFLSYTGSPDRLVNQGWKDSTDGVQHADGRTATPPVALSEVQAYAYQAAVLGAGLLDAFGRPGGERRREWAAALAERFRARFWVDGYPAIALDGRGEPVDGPASNMGHLLGTGLLTPAEEDLVAARLAELDSGWGLRTLGTASAGFDPLSYHLGSVWPHDTVIAVLGLVRAGHPGVAAGLARGLIAAAPGFGHRLPELFGGQAAPPGHGSHAERSRRAVEHSGHSGPAGRTDDGATAGPVPYPAACRPQAWAAAVSPALVTALLGLDVDVPSGRLAVSPLPGFGPLSVSNVRVGAAAVSIDVDPQGAVSLIGVPPDLTLDV